MILSPTFENHREIVHGFLTRRGGESAGVFASLNCGYGSGDDRDAVHRNREHAVRRIGLRAGSLVTAYQTHSAAVTRVTQPWESDAAPRVDAMVTNTPGIALGILTADCAPVLLAAPAAGVIGAAHAGWRGAKDGVLEAALDAMAALGARAEDVTAAIGPCIQRSSYEVDAAFRGDFLADDAGNADFFTPGDRPGHFQFDLAGYIVRRLSNRSVGRIDDLSLDTYADEERFFSYRRATHQGEKRYGRLLSAIALRPA